MTPHGEADLRLLHCAGSFGAAFDKLLWRLVSFATSFISQERLQPGSPVGAVRMCGAFYAAFVNYFGLLFSFFTSLQLFFTDGIMSGTRV